MSQLTGLALAAVLSAAVGCAKDASNLTTPSTSAKKEETFEGSPKAVAAAAQVAIEQMGVQWIPSKDAGVRLGGTTSAGKNFIMTFVRHRTADGERTAIHIDWVNGADERFWMEFMGTMTTALESQQRKAQVAGN